ncbi:MAG: methyltransferase [Flavobacteriales bacterium]|nr:methyltransferase [Flavobacteriales bacterium]
MTTLTSPTTAKTGNGHAAPPPPAQMLQLIMGFWTSCSIYVAARLNIADHLRSGPRTAEELAALTHAHGPSLFRLLRALCAVGVFTLDDRQRFALTPLGETLCQDVPGSLRAMAIAQLGDHYKAWGDLLHSVKTGGIAFDHVEGMPVWKYYETHPEDGLNFVQAMAGLTGAVIMNVLPVYDFTRFGTIVDVGGGNGALLSAVLDQAKHSKGIVYDEAHVVKETEVLLRERGSADRCTAVAGSFFDSVPAGGDAYMMKLVLHDWNDEQCVRILRNCAEAMGPDGVLLVLDAVIPTGNDPHPGKFMDLNMLVMTGGRERTQEEFAGLFKRAGLELSRVVHTHSPLVSIVEAVKV